MNDRAYGRIRPINAGDSPDPDVNEILHEADVGWWEDSRMWGIFAHIPESLKAWRRLIFATAFELDPVTWELMALRGAFVTQCYY